LTRRKLLYVAGQAGFHLHAIWYLTLRALCTVAG
jgi:hypothetical protein